MLMIRNIFIMCAGVFAMAGALNEWEFFFKHRKAQWMVNHLGKNGAKIFYFVLGLVAFLAGLGLFLGWIPESAE